MNIQQCQRKALYRFLIAQSAFAFGVGGILSFLAGFEVGYSVIVGSLTSILGNLCFVSRFFADKKSFAGKIILTDFYRGAVRKFILTIALFLLAICVFKVAFVSYMVAFILTQLSTSFLPRLWQRSVTIQPD